MDFDAEGHLRISPREFQTLLLDNSSRLINDVLLHGTPTAFLTFQAYRDFVDFLSGELAIHPSSIIFRGSAKLGFSITPQPEKIWKAMGSESDIDLAIVDPDHYHFLDSQIRRYERASLKFRGKEYTKWKHRKNQRSFYCYRYMDLPDTSLVQQNQSIFDRASSLDSPGCGRLVTAFFFRDWWALFSRCECDLRELLRGLRKQVLPAGPEHPMARQD